MILSKHAFKRGLFKIMKMPQTGATMLNLWGPPVLLYKLSVWEPYVTLHNMPLGSIFLKPLKCLLTDGIGFTGRGITSVFSFCTKIQPSPWVDFIS